jgi:orotate phosphoribosyltransferase
MSWKKESFYDFIMQNHVIGFFKEPLTLKSGRLSYWYVNWRTIAEDVFALDQLSDYVIQFVKDKGLNPDCFFGVPEGATKLGIITQYKWAKSQNNYSQGKYPLSMGRAKPKGHGDPKDQYFLGVPKGTVIVLEDTVTTGESLIETVEKLMSLKVKIISVICLTNRNELRDDNLNVMEIFEKLGVKFYTMSDAIDLLPKAYRILHPGQEIAKRIELYFKQYGVKEIKLI